MRTERIEQLLEEANALQREALTMQKQALDAQREIIERTRGNLDKASAVNAAAADLQRTARAMLKWLVPLVVVIALLLLFLGGRR